MPQFDLFFFPVIVFFSLLMFLLLYVFITKSLVPSLARVIKIRSKVFNLRKKRSIVPKKDIYSETFKQFF